MNKNTIKRLTLGLLLGAAFQSKAMYLYEYEAEELKREQLEQEQQESQIQVFDDKKPNFSLSINIQDDWGDTELHRAVRLRSNVMKNLDDDEETVQKLLEEKNTDVTIQNKSGYTPLHIAVKLGKKTLVAMLLKKGAKTNTKNNKGNTPLHTAVFYEIHERFNKIDRDTSKNITNILLESNADLSIKNDKDETPYDMAKAMAPEYLYLLLRLQQTEIRNKFGTCVVLNTKNLDVMRAIGHALDNKKYKSIGQLYCDLVHKDTCGLFCDLDHRVKSNDTSPRLDLMFYLIANENTWTIKEALKISTGQKNRQEKALEEQTNMKNFKKYFDCKIIL